MFFDIPTLERRKIPFDQVFAPGSIDFLDENLTQAGDLEAAGVAELVDPFGVREIRVRGSLRGEMQTACARCLEPIRLSVSGPVDLFYRPMAAIAREEEVAISEAEAEMGFYEGGGIELADVVREQVTMVLPMRSVCREDCRGICPICGKNRNRETCRCRVEFADPRWEALRDWKN
ncbi:MAG TPA: DUF177 domain-containing protein [Bryobacterales bacterium]|nr:DUF177 domain-containing protein [Bryobacterales bacterium]